MADKAVARGYGAALLDRLAGWQAGLPSESCSYTVKAVKIPLGSEDGIQLAADVYQPVPRNSEAPAGTILIQCPYGRGFPLSLFCASIFAARGYVVLFVSSRGTFGSGGKFNPARTEVADGPRVLEWMRKQSWYTGTFATFGASFLGYAQWVLMGSEQPPDDLVASIVHVGPHNFSKTIWGTGSFMLATVDWAAMTLAAEEAKSLLHMMWYMLRRNAQGLIDVKKSVPLLDAVNGHFGDKVPWLGEWLARPNIETDPSYELMKQDKALEITKVPVLLLGGWYDLFLDDTLQQYQRLHERGCNVALTVAPLNHTQAPSAEGVTREALDWLDEHLGKRSKGEIRPAPVRVNVTGADEWRWLPSWPPATKPLEMFLDVKGLLSQSQPDNSDESEFTFDPHDPTPTIGGPLLFGGGKVDDSALAKRHDVLSFTTTPLDHAIEVLGTPRIELLHSSDNPHVDLFVRLSEVDTKGISRNITQVYKRLDPGRTRTGQAAKIELELSACAHRFKKGTAIRVVVAGGCFPHYAFNLGSGESQATGTTLKPAKHTIHFAASEGSKVVLPVSVG